MPSCLVVLSAGSSTRLGSPKQAVKYQGTNLIERILAIAEESDFDNSLVVLGAQAEVIRALINPKRKVDFMINESWTDGMSSSIRCGVQGAIDRYNPDYIGITVIDQPYLEVSILNSLLDKCIKSGMISASKYNNGKVGVPACFPQKWHRSLIELTGDKGARTLINDPELNIQTIEFAKGGIDIDTPEDVQNL